MSNYLYGLTVQGIQSYIFSTNKLREIAGASEIIEQLCTQKFQKFINTNSIDGILYLSAAGNIRFRVETLKDAQTIYKNYPTEIQKFAPGVSFSQAVVELDPENGNEAIDELNVKLRGQRNNPQFSTDLGVMARSRYRRTGEGCVSYKNEEGELVDLSTSRKLEYLKYGNKGADKSRTALEIKTEIQTEGEVSPAYPKEFEEITEGGVHSWMALVHIDGNGMGAELQKLRRNNDDHSVFDKLKKFSDDIEAATVASYKRAIKRVVLPVSKNGKVPLRPIILGGDDLTFIIRADLAVPFTAAYLEEFEKQTSKKFEKGLTACGGIAFVKEKFPFYFAAQLAESLCKYAKDKCGRDHSCLQFYQVQDSFIEDYDKIQIKEFTGVYKESGTGDTTKENMGESKEPFINEFKFNADPYYLIPVNSKPTIAQLLKDMHTLSKDDAPTNGMREWVDQVLEESPMAGILMQRLKDKTEVKEYREILGRGNYFMDSLSLLSVSTKGAQTMEMDYDNQT